MNDLSQSTHLRFILIPDLWSDFLSSVKFLMMTNKHYWDIVRQRLDLIGPAMPRLGLPLVNQQSAESVYLVKMSGFVTVLQHGITIITVGRIRI